MAVPAQDYRQPNVTSTETVETVESDSRPVTDADADKAHGKVLAVRIIWFVTGVLMILLGMRFVLALLGANPASGFVDFIYSFTAPFVAPFFGAFNYTAAGYVTGTSYVEGFTLLAMLVYLLIAWGITKLLTIRDRNPAA